MTTWQGYNHAKFERPLLKQCEEKSKIIAFFKLEFMSPMSLSFKVKNNHRIVWEKAQ